MTFEELVSEIQSLNVDLATAGAKEFQSKGIVSDWPSYHAGRSDAVDAMKRVVEAILEKAAQ